MTQSHLLPGDFVPEITPLFIKMTREHVNDLSSRKKVDRVIMADLVRDVVMCAGGEIDEVIEAPEDRYILINVKAPGGLNVGVELDGFSALGDHQMLLSWHMDSSSPCLLKQDSLGGRVNPVHHHKATQVCDTFYDMLNALKSGIEGAVNGDIYQEVERPVDAPPLARPRAG